jgi:hypothetical protein
LQKAGQNFMTKARGSQIPQLFPVKAIRRWWWNVEFYMGENIGHLWLVQK